MSIAPPPPAHPTWPPQQYPPPPPARRRRLWPAAAAAAAIGAIAAGTISTFITLAVTTPPTTSNAKSSTAETSTVTAAPPSPPPPLPTAQADAQTCHAWQTTDTLYTAAAMAQSVIPQGTTIDMPVVRDTPAWTAGVMRASDIYAQAANTLESQIAPGTSPMLAQVAQTTVGSLRTLSEAFKTYDPISGNSAAVYSASQDALNWLCR